jgi:hypothetical protein
LCLLEYVPDLLAEIGRVEVLFHGCAQFLGDSLEVCSPVAYGAPEGKDRLQGSGFGRQMSIMVRNRFRAARRSQACAARSRSIARRTTGHSSRRTSTTSD